MFETIFKQQKSDAPVATKQSGYFSDVFSTTPTKTVTKPAPAPTTTPVVPPKPTVKVLPETLGGGAFNMPANGALNLSKRGYGSLESETGQERDHVVPVSLGGVSKDDNLQYLESKGKTPDKRQAGKLEVELQAIKEYKAGTISLAEARARVLGKQQELKGLKPTEAETQEPGGKGAVMSLVDKAYKTVKNVFTKPTVLKAEVGDGLSDEQKKKADAVIQKHINIEKENQFKLEDANLKVFGKPSEPKQSLVFDTGMAQPPAIKKQIAYQAAEENAPIKKDFQSKIPTYYSMTESDKQDENKMTLALGVLERKKQVNQLPRMIRKFLKMVERSPTI